jgi:hypothetical protein
LIVKFINPTAVENVGMNTQTTPIRDAVKPVPSPMGDAPAQERGAQGAGGQPLPIEILSDLVDIRESLEVVYDRLKRVMAYVQNNDSMYTVLEEARKALINVIQLMNQAIDFASPYEVVEA